MGKGAINYGVEVLQSESFLVTKSSTNVIKELRGDIASRREGWQDD